MTQLIIRKLLVNLESGFPKDWVPDNIYLTQFFNALSMSFPAGEQTFIDSVRDCMGLLSEAQRQQLAPDIQGFIGQEATHRRMHNLFNQVLTERHGLANVIEPRINQLFTAARKLGLKPIVFLGITAGIEHFTAVLAYHLFTHRDTIQLAPQDVQTLWFWHSSEEAEHRAVALKMYRAISSSEFQRIVCYFIASFLVIFFIQSQVFHNLWKSGNFWRLSTWWGALRFHFSRRNGILWYNTLPLLRYMKKDFDPLASYGDDPSLETLAKSWLNEHQAQWQKVGG